MTNRERDLSLIYGINPKALANRQADLKLISEGILNTDVSQYGIRIQRPDDSHWWDTISSLMQSKHETYISSLNDDNRNDEKEIEILEDASSIIENGELDRLRNLEQLYTTSHASALNSGDTLSAKHYENLAKQIREEYYKKSSIVNLADSLVNSDKKLILNGHNPILETIGEVFDATATGAGIGAAAGSPTGIGAIPGGIIGAMSGLLYGTYDVFSSGRNKIDRSAYSEPLSDNKIENYRNSIASRQSYKDFRSKLIEDEQEDLFYWKTQYPVSDYYRYIESTGKGNYLYYNLPGIVGSSFSDTKDAGQQLVGTYGAMKLASKVGGPVKYGLRAVAFINALRNGWQQSLNENHAEVSEVASKKVIDAIKENKELHEEMLNGARQVAVDKYGLTESEAKDLIDDTAALMMYQGSVGGLNPRALTNNYEYYKAARQVGDSGADTQFVRDMMATAGTDALEAALMITPYGAFAKKSKIFGRAIAGAAIGSAAGQFFGFGVGGSAIGGILGGLAAQNRMARKIWSSSMRKTQAIEDRFLPRLERQIMFDKGLHAASAFGVSSLAEAAEEGVQYLNSLDAERILNEAKDDDALGNISSLFINDLKKRGEVFNAVLSQIGLTDSPYQSDQEFWQNWKGGLMLGGLMTGATVSLQEAIGIKKAYQTAKFLQDEVLSSAVANRVASQDAILKGAAFAKYGANGDINPILEIIERAKNKNKNRIDTVYSDQDFDDLSLLANRIISKIQHKAIKQRLKLLGYELGSEEANYAIAINDYYQLKTRENRYEESLEYGEKIALQNDPNVIEALNTIAGPEPVSADSFEDADDSSFTYKVRGKDGSIEEKIVSNRQRLMLLHQNTAELIAVAQLLKDLQDILKVQEFAKSKGIAFSKALVDSTISLLKDKFNLLKNDVELYANEQFDSQTTSYDLQIEHLKGYLLDQTSGLKLVDLYRNSVLRMLNQRVYTNIIKSIAIDTDIDATNKEVLDASKNMTKRFIDNVLKNKNLLEILDYNIETDSESAQPTEQELASGSSDTDSLEPESVEPSEEREDDRSWFLKMKDRINRFFFNDDDTFLETDEEEPILIKEPEPEAAMLSTEPQPTVEEPAAVEEKEPEVQEDVETPPDIIPEDLESAALPQDPQEQVDSSTPATNDDTAEIIPDDEKPNNLIITEDLESVSIPEDSESAIIIEDEDQEDLGGQIEDKQLETINMLSTAPKDAPRKLIDGWYVDKDGKIIPSDKMYIMNPVETPAKRGADFAKKYRLAAALIRYDIHRYILDKSQNGSIRLKLYIAKILKTADPVVVDTITKAIQNGDQNAVKLIVIQSNPRAWDSYYTNEFFRDAARKILNGQPVQRPEYIDKDAFKKFCREVILYKNRMQTLYGYKFVTQVSPFITKIDGEDVIADPDFIAVDRAGNAHIVNVYTIANYIYLKRQSSAEMYTMQLENTENLFSLDQERNILADILMKAIRDGGNVIASSAMLLPIVVDGYTAIHRLYLGKLISLQPNDESMSKYIDLEDQLLELKELLVNANEKAKQVTDDFNNTIDSLHKYRAESKRSGYRLRKKQFVPDKEPTSIAETYAQLDKALEAIQSSQKYYADHMAKEVSEMEAFYKEQSNQNRKSEIADRILRINNMPDETQTSGVLIEIIDGDEIINNSDIITNGVAKATLQESSDGGHYIKYSIEYKGKSYSIRIYKNRDKKYGKKNGDIFKLNEHPNYTAKMRAIVELLSENPGLVLTFDLQRSFIKYGEDAPVAKPRGITEKEGLLSKTDVENLGIQQNDGKIVSIGFYDKKTGVIQTGQNSQSATLAHAPEGEWWLNQMFLVIKQKHLEERKAPDRTVAIPLIRKKFDKKLARFIATCYKVIAETNHLAGYDSLKKREFANQMLHLFISERKVYKKGEQELPNIVYINGDAVRVNGVEYYLLNKQGFEDFVKALQSCEIMPSWNTFNSKFKNLASGPFSQLYDHFSTSSNSLKVSIDGIDSGLEITKDQFDNDTLCQWLVKNLFFASKHYVAREPVVSIHNIKVVSELLQEVKDEEKQNELVIKESKPVEKQTPKEESIVMTEEEFNKLGLEEVDEDEEDEEDDEYASPIIPVNGDFTTIRRIKTSNDVIKTIRKKYPRLAKLLNTAISKIGLPDIKVVISDAEGETAMINGVLRTKLGNVILNKDGSWTITIFKNAKNPVKTLAHETVHIFTLGAIDKNGTVAKACKLFYQYCKDSFTKDEQPYGFKSFKEFIAEFFVNDEFRDYLKLKAPIEQLIFDFAVKNIPQEHKSRIRTLYDSIVSLFSKIWQKYILRQSPSLYSLIYDTMSKLFGEAENIRINGESAEYAIENHVTHQKITLLNCKSRAELKAAIDGIMTAWILHENITALGKNIDKLNFSTSAIQKRLEQDLEFSQWYQRTFTYSDIPLVRELTKVSRPTREDLKTEDNPEGFIFYEKKVKTEITIQKKDGTTITKTVKMPKTFTTVHLDNWDIMTPIVDEFMSDMRIETRKKVQLREEDSEMEQREEGRNVMGELLTESYEISPFDRASREVKWMFSTVPYGKVVETQDGLEWEPTGDNNEFGMNTFMPFRNVYGRVLYYTANCTTTELILNKFYSLAHTGPDKAMFLYLYKRLSELIANRWKPLQEEGNKSNPTKNAQGLVFDANIDSTIVKVIRALRQQLNDFIWATSKDVTDKDGNKLKQIDIRTTLYQKKAIETTRSWKDQLATGMSDVLKYDPETLTYKFKPGIKINVFKKIYSDLFVGPNSFISAYNKLRKQDPEDVTLDWLYLENPGIKFSEITADDVKTYLHNALLHCGVDISEEILDQWLLQIMEDNPTITTLMDALYAMLSDQHSNIRPSNFFARLANVEENGHQLDSAITVETITIAFNSGFVKELANKLNEYDLRTQGLMTVAAHNNQYYIVSEPNYVNDVKDIINSGDRNDKYIQMLMEDSFASGSVIVESLLKNKPIHLDAATFVGMKTENVGDQGRDYFEIELNEDIISKLELLQEGFMLAPTISDKKTYHVLRGIPLVGMLRGVKSNSQCYSVDTSTGQISIIDLLILDRFIAYFKSERDAVEKAVVAYENKFYKNNPGKKIANYSDKNGLKFSSFCCLPLANGDKIYLNRDTSEDPRVNLNLADERFFKASKYEQRAIILRILLARAQEEMKKIEEVGLIKRNDNGNYENVGLDGATILEMAERRVKAAFGDKGRLSDYVDKDGKHAGPRKEFAISSAIREYCLDCAIKHLMSMQEYLRLFSGSKSFYKWKTKGKHVTDISVDYTKRRGGDISTGGVNIFDIDPIAGMEELGTYRCIEVEDYLVESNTLGQTALILQFLTSELVSAAHQILSNDAAALNLDTGRSSLLSRLYQNRDTAEKIIFEAYSKEYKRFHGDDDEKAADYATGIINVLKEKAKANAMQYFRDISDKEDPINVADGATYITDRMCERLLREEGKYDDDMKYAFEVLRGEHGQDVLSEEGRKLYKSILNVIIGTLKYTATGFRKSDDGQGGTLMTPYYNKTALFPVFEQIAYGKMGQILQAMRNNNVDVMMMTSAVKTGSQGAITLDQMISGESFNDHTYIQEIRFLRKQLNTDPNEREEMNLGTQTIKIALSNLRADDDYVDPFTGKTVKGHELYSTIMRCYNILTDIGYEQVMMRFAKKRPDGTPSFENSLPAAFDDERNVIDLDTNIISSIPDIDEEALSTFLHEELMSRDANDNMFDAIAYDKETDRLAAPMSAISQSGWIDSILSAYISKTVIDTKSPGAAYILRSVFAMEGEAMKMINDGEDLKLVNEDGSMDAVISIDFFEKIIPDYENKTFEEARQWLIEHKLVGKEAKTYTISYRIPTLAQASINALKFVDVVPIIRDSIILPKDFTRLTGSDFDIDKLFLSRMFINPETVNDENNMFTFFDNVDDSNKNELLKTLHKAFINKLFLNYITLLMDKNSANTKYRSIDADTDLWKDVYKDLYPELLNPVESMQQDTIAYQTEQKNNFVVGKIGIGPFALNNNNHIYTMLYNISVRSRLLNNLGPENLNMSTLYRGSDIYGNSIMSWLSGGINAHVDIAKDPFITKLNINKYTYNICNFLLRSGFGRNALWFLNQSAIKELARRQNNITGQYLKTTTKSLFDALKDVFEAYKNELAELIPEEVLNKTIDNDFEMPITHPDGSVTYHSSLSALETALGRPLTIKDVLLDKVEVFKAIKYSKNLDENGKYVAAEGLRIIYSRDFERPYANDMVEKDETKSMIYNAAKYGDSSNVENAPIHPAIQKYMSIVIFDKINSNEAKICSDVVKFTKIDTKKHGSTIAAQLDYRIEYLKFIGGLESDNPKVLGMTEDLFGISDTDNADVLGSLSSINLHGGPVISNYTGLPGTSINQVTSGTDITEAGYVKYNRNEFSSFIHNKTRKAINSLTSVLRHESVESTYGFEYIWRVVKNDFGKSALTEDMQTKLRSVILGAIKSLWVFSKMKSLGIDPISLFKDGENTFSLAHELYRMKTLSIRYTDQNHVNRKGEVRPKTIITTVGKLFKDNELLKILHDGHSKDEYSLNESFVDVLDFIKVHVPFTDDTKDSNKYIDAWRQLYLNDLTKDFAIKLMFYSFITSNDSGGSNLFKYVPFEMLKEYGLFEAERNMISQLNDLAFLYSKDQKLLEDAVRPIVDRVETILCEDFDFSLPYHLESIEERQDKITGQKTRVPVLQYTGFASKFGKEISRKGVTEKCDRIPYIFIPARINAYNGISMSKTVNVNRPYIRVYNPVRNYENEEKYFIYKRIGEIFISNTMVLPIYKLVNSSMYTLGQYKVYNYDNEMAISSTRILKTISSYVLSESYSIDDINGFISKILKDIEAGNSGRRMRKNNKTDAAAFKAAAAPLYALDDTLNVLHKKHVAEVRVFDIRTKLLKRFEDNSYIEFYRNQHDTGKADTVANLNFVKESDLFTEEEKSIANQMLAEINKYNEILQQIKENRKQPTRQVDPRTYHMHSGGAFGSDTAWGYYAQQYGIPDDPQHISHYYFGQKTPTGNVAITQEQFFEGLDKVFMADQTLHRFDNMSEDRQQKVAPLLARNWMQVKNSDSIFAIGELKYGKVDGGTGWAVLMAIDAGKPVHVFNLSTEQWFTYSNESRTWVVENTPKLTKNFAGIGTRTIDKDIERKTAGYKKPIKYVGDAKRQAAIDAINDVYRNTFGDPKPQPKNPEEFNGKNNPPENFNGPKESQEVLESANTILSNKELLKLKPYTGSDTHPRIAVASEHADPAFFAQQIVGLFDEGKPLVVKQMNTVKTGEKTADGRDKWERREVETTYTADDFDALYIITKHDGLPLKKILLTKIPKLIHFSVTGMGNTAWEPGVMKYQDMLKRIKDFMKMGLDPEMVTMRIDPIIPGVTPFEVIEDIVKKSVAMGIKTIKFSVMDWYKSTAPEVVKNTGYDYSKYYEQELDKDNKPLTYWWCPKDKDGKPILGLDGKPQWEKHIVYKPHAKVEEQKKISDFMLSLKDKYGVTLQSCAEPLIQEGIEKVGCLSVPAINNMLGTHIEDRGVDNNKQRALCTCYGGKTDLMAYNANCASVCWYCYAHHQGDKILNYYNEDGTLKDNAWTRTGYEEQTEDVVSEEITRVVQDNGKIRLSLSSHTDEKPRQIVLEPQGDNKYYVHIRVWDGDKVPGKMSDEDKRKLFDALYNELPEGAEILLPKSGEGYYATRGTIAAMQRLSRDNRFTPGAKGVVKYEDKDGSIKEYEGTSFIKSPNKKIPQEAQLSVDPESWSKKEGWSVDYFNKKVAPNIDTAWLIEYELVSDQEPVTSNILFTMYFPYGNNKRSDVQSTTTFDAILNRERTATTRYEGLKGLDAWKNLKVGDIIEIRDTLNSEPNSRTLRVRITVPAHKLSSILQEQKTINVSSYDEETKSLSNFAIRPFETELAKGTPKMKVKSVEHAFLSSKAYFAWNRGDITDKQFWDFIKYINAREGKDVKSAGRAIPMSLTTIDEWNKVSDKVLEVMMLKSFLLNETAASQLLNTGNAEFTHNYKNGQPIEPKTPKRFGDLLSKVRSKLRDESNRKQECK